MVGALRVGLADHKDALTWLEEFPDVTSELERREPDLPRLENYVSSRARRAVLALDEVPLEVLLRPLLRRDEDEAAAEEIEISEPPGEQPRT